MLSLEDSDDEEVAPQSIANYYFVDDDESPISFSVLPLHFDDGQKQDVADNAVFLHGTTDGGLQKVYKRVIGWKLVFEDVEPKIMVLSKDKKWISLVKPRNSYYEDTIRTIMITVHLLHFLRKNPQATKRSLRKHLRTVFSTFDVRPSHNDVREHVFLMKLFSARDETLANSELFQGFIMDKPRKRFSEDDQDASDVKQSFIVDDDEDEGPREVDEGPRDDAVNEEQDDNSDLYDSVCAICDDGGNILCCDGPCLRSFHAYKSAGKNSLCRSLGFATAADVELIQNFLCNNCLYKQHQCFCCGKLGSSDKTNGAEVYACVSATCGHFYHPKCVAEWVFPHSESEASEFRTKIIAGEFFTCPVHKCVVCKQGENKEVKDLRFAMCRRCPKSYHRKCLPREIAFKNNEGIEQRAWDDLHPNRILIFCLKHHIKEGLGTPIRNHIIFPQNPETEKRLDLPKRKVKASAEKKSIISSELTKNQVTLKPVKVASSEGNRSKEKVARIVVSQKKEQESIASPRHERGKYEKIIAGGKIPVEESRGIAPAPSSIVAKRPSSFPSIDNEAKARASEIFKQVSASLSMEDIIRKYPRPSTHSYGSGTRHNIDKSITLGKVEGSVEAIRTVLQKLEKGGSVEDAKAICEPEILRQMIKWRERLRVYLAPFLHGMRYTSFGRHFTNVDKLKQIVDKMQWYVQDGDTVVDFCCGANDFSILMKEKLDSAGKKCNFKNYDIIQPKNDFNFERRDWMTVKPHELPTGSKLIMGLNPPFGVKAALANKFIDHALKFKPKLVILIVPKETERLDKKQSKYDLIWEDSQSLSGKSFYLPGSVDVNDNQLEQWNLSPPPLNLWSRDDWTVKHKRIAARQGHIVEDQGPPFRKGILSEKPVDSLPAEDHTEAEILVKDATLEEKKARDENHKSSDGTKRKISPGHASTISRKRRRKKKGQVQEERKNDVELSDISILPDQNRNTPSHLPLEPSSVAPQERDSHFTTGVEFSFKAGGGPASSVMDRYAPHLDMTKYAMPISQVPFGQCPGRSDPYDNIHGARRDQANFPRFPSGPHSSSSSRGNSCGWID
ncbi:protein ENHANCED DOWNY MILDEW 2-like isoform X1 [Zingiber officinale]|uniref:protein ENHANCED DOWNY MILDEW 2-like isoform X1 n=2 Tax=Zingiber officinale TaxID=94328 RepID=UPI001C4B760E|nr:protein ENHANCED DOWNY MILDEW 2-like isoform X1 [Zingiber officinale]XP_042418885.1 protein ENHANCED DOWNY MILDEW 2-like isoform X1 [Zingiber officinale]